MQDHHSQNWTLGARGMQSVDAVYGAYTQQCLTLYPTAAARTIGDYPQLVTAMLLVKTAAARTNGEIGAIEAAHAGAIIAAADMLLSAPFEDTFPVHAFHGGGGIAFHMNANEAIAQASSHDLHLNDHITLNHSTSDSLSTACHIAARQAWATLRVELTYLASDLQQIGPRSGEARKLARTCLQDAVDIGVGDYFGGIASNISRGVARADAAATVLSEVNIGGNIIGRTDDCTPAFFDSILPTLNKVLTAQNWQAGLTHAPDLFAASHSHDGLQALASVVEQIARSLIRFAGDLRLMSSGPVCGLGEITLPSVQAGSAAIPGKVNPAIPEFVIQSAMMACGAAQTIKMAEDHGELDYNPWQMVIITSLLDMMAGLTDAVASLRTHCIAGLQINADRNAVNVQSIAPLLMQIKRARGYAAASAVAAKAEGDVDVVRAALNDIQSKDTSNAR